MDIQLTSRSVQQTIEIGEQIGVQLKGGEVFAVTGSLGAGKTHLIKGIVSGSGVTESEQINSPTFVLINEYHSRFAIYHIDAYRIENEKQFEALGVDDLYNPCSVVLIEWADKVQKELQDLDIISIHIEHLDETSRTIEISNLPEHIKVENL